MSTIPAPNLSSLGAWALMGLLTVTIAIAYILRSPPLARSLGLISRGHSYLSRMRAHIWLGYIIVVLAAVHATAAMSAGPVARLNLTGLGLAAVAYVSVVAQFALGYTLANPTLRYRAGFRRGHFWVMVVLVVAALGHTVLNSPMLGVLFQ